MIISKNTIYSSKSGRHSLFASCLLLFQFVSGSVVGQDGSTPLATVGYEVQKIVTFGIPDQVDLGALDDYDLAIIRPYAKQHRVTQSLFATGNIETTSVYPEGKGNPDTWIRPIYKSVSDYFGVKFYDAQNVETYRSRFELPNEPEPYDAASLANFGYVSPITAPSAQDLTTMVSAGFQVKGTADGSYAISDGETTYLIDPVKQTNHTSIRKDGELILDEKISLVQLANGKYVIGSKENKTYHRTLKGDFLIEETDVETYFNFARDNQNLGTVARQSENRPSSAGLGKKEMYSYAPQPVVIDFLSVGPNPTAGYLSVTLESAMDAANSLELLDLSGKVIKQFSDVVPRQVASIDVNDLPAGTYVLRCSNTAFSLHQKIVKQ